MGERTYNVNYVVKHIWNQCEPKHFEMQFYWMKINSYRHGWVEYTCRTPPPTKRQVGFTQFPLKWVNIAKCVPFKQSPDTHHIKQVKEQGIVKRDQLDNRIKTTDQKWYFNTMKYIIRSQCNDKIYIHKYLLWNTCVQCILIFKQHNFISKEIGMLYFNLYGNR